MKRTEKNAPRDARICIVEASLQNAFFGELLDALEGELAAAGVAVERAVDHFPAARGDLTYLFVPHEYLPLTEPEVHPTPQQLRRSLVLATEQAGTQWFELTASVAAQAGAVLDINELGISEWFRRGIVARRLEIGYVPAWDRWQGREDQPRDIDLAFLGGHTERRARIIAGCADVLAGRRVRLHLTETAAPHVAGAPGFLQGPAKWDLLGRTRILLNIHRDELPYLEWVRAAEAISNGCVLMTEHSNGFGPLEPQRHFVSVAHQDLPHAIESLLDDQPRLERIRHEAYDLAREQLPLRGAAAVVAETAGEVLAAAPAVDAEATGVTAPTPRLLPRRAPQVEQIRSERTELDVVRGALKRLVLEQRELRALVERQEQRGGPAPGATAPPATAPGCTARTRGRARA